MKISRSRQFRVNSDVLAPSAEDDLGLCDEWAGHCNSKSGHGQRWDPHAKKVRGAHVMAWEEANGRRVLPGEVVRHRCDNPPCVRPSHLLIGNHKDNRNDLKTRHPERISLPPVLRNEEHPNVQADESSGCDYPSCLHRRPRAEGSTSAGVRRVQDMDRRALEEGGSP